MTVKHASQAATASSSRGAVAIAANTAGSCLALATLMKLEQDRVFKGRSGISRAAPIGKVGSKPQLTSS